MAEVIPGKTRNVPKKAKQKLLENAFGKNAFSKCKQKLKKRFSRTISGFHKSGKKQKKRCTGWKNAFFSHLEIVEIAFFCIL